jgi:hypothetical protein
MASLFEINNEYEKAKKMYEILGDLFDKHQLQYSWIAENSIKEINGKIYKMNLYLDE